MDAMDFTESSSAKVKKCQEYMDALEEERRKIQVFQRELPLSLDLINQAIENCRQQLEANNTDGEEEEEEQTTSNEGPVLEEFIPLKRTPSSSDFKHLNKSSNNNNNNNNNNDTKVDWMKSVQLWNQNPDPVLKQELPKKTAVIESKKIGGAFHPFHKSTEISSSTTATTTTITTTTTTPPSSIATSSTTETVDERDEQNHKSDNNNRRDEKERDRQGGQSSSRKTRRCWSPELHRRFLHALQQLGGSHVATPKQIRELMKVDGLTNDEVKSHLQKYRLHTRRPSPAMHNNGNTHQPPQFVVVGGIWVPPQEYSTAVAAKAGDSAHGNSSNGIYAPVALPPQASSPPIYPPTHQKQQQHKQLQQSPTGPLHSSEEGRSSRAEHSIGDNDDDGDNDVVNCRSPSMSSSTHNSTASLTL